MVLAHVGACNWKKKKKNGEGKSPNDFAACGMACGMTLIILNVMYAEWLMEIN